VQVVTSCCLTLGIWFLSLSAFLMLPLHPRISRMFGSTAGLLRGFFNSPTVFLQLFSCFRLFNRAPRHLTPTFSLNPFFQQGCSPKYVFWSFLCVRYFDYWTVQVVSVFLWVVNAFNTFLLLLRLPPPLSKSQVLLSWRSIIVNDGSAQILLQTSADSEIRILSFPPGLPSPCHSLIFLTL